MVFILCGLHVETPLTKPSMVSELSPHMLRETQAQGTTGYELLQIYPSNSTSCRRGMGAFPSICQSCRNRTSTRRQVSRIWPEQPPPLQRPAAFPLPGVLECVAFLGVFGLLASSTVATWPRYQKYPNGSKANYYWDRKILKRDQTLILITKPMLFQMLVCRHFVVLTTSFQACTILYPLSRPENIFFEDMLLFFHAAYPCCICVFLLFCTLVVERYLWNSLAVYSFMS